jgi:hypothetical protein
MNMRERARRLKAKEPPPGHGGLRVFGVACGALLLAWACVAGINEFGDARDLAYVEHHKCGVDHSQVGVVVYLGFGWTHKLPDQLVYRCVDPELYVYVDRKYALNAWYPTAEVPR